MAGLPALANCGDFLGLDSPPPINASLKELFTPKAIEMLGAAVDRLKGADAVERLFGV